MPQRKVAVELEMEVARYVRGGSEADVVTRRVRASIHDLGDEADATGRDLDQLAVNADVAKRQVDDLGDEARGAAAELAGLDREVDKLNRSLATQRLLSGAEGLFPTGHGFAGRIAQWAVPIGVMLAPAIGSAVGVAILGAVGTGGLIGGAILATRDPRVKAVWTDLGREVFRDLIGGAQPFTEEMIAAANDWERAWQRAAPHVRDILVSLSGDVRPIAAGLSGLIEHSLPGLERGIRASKGLADEWAKTMPDLGNAVSDMMDSFASGLPGERQFFHDAIEGTGKLLVGLGNFAELMSKIYAIPLVGRPPISVAYDVWDQANMFFRRQHPLASGLTAVSRDLRPGALEQRSAAAYEELEARLKATGQAAINSRLATIQYRQSLLDLAETIHGSSNPTLDLSTQKGLDNARAFIEVAQNARDMRDAMIATGVPTATANIIMATAMQRIEDQAGRNRKAVHDLIAELEAVPALTVAQIRLEFEREGTMLGEHAGLRLSELNPPSSIVMGPSRGSFVPAAITTRAPDSRAFIDLPGRAAGGPAYAGQRLTVNEQRLEAFVAPDRGYVMPLVPDAAPMPLMMPAGGGSGTRTIRIIEQDTSGRTLRETLIDDAYGRGVREDVIIRAYP